MSVDPADYYAWCENMPPIKSRSYSKSFSWDLTNDFDTNVKIYTFMSKITTCDLCDLAPTTVDVEVEYTRFLCENHKPKDWKLVADTPTARRLYIENIMKERVEKKRCWTCGAPGDNKAINDFRIRWYCKIHDEEAKEFNNGFRPGTFVED